MTEKTKAELLQELEVTKATLGRYKEYMRIVASKARGSKEMSDSLFKVLRNYKMELRNE